MNDDGDDEGPNLGQVDCHGFSAWLPEAADLCFDYLDSFDVAVLCLHRDDCTRMESYPFIRVIQLIFPWNLLF